MTGVSVITPTLGQPALVERLLASSANAATSAGIQWEHLIVDSTNGSQAAAIEQACRKHGASYLRGPDRVGVKRNVGAANAQNEVLLFIDSDCEASTELFRRHLSAYMGTECIGGVAGPTVMLGDNDSFVWQVLSRAKQYNHCYSWPLRYTEVGWSTTSNLSIRADVFRLVGGFDGNTLTVVGGEDVDLGVRIRKAGFRILTDSEAVVWHARVEGLTLRSVARRVFDYGMADGWLCKQHPDLVRAYANPFSTTAATLAAALPLMSVWHWYAGLLGPVVLIGQVLLEATKRHERGTGPYGFACGLLAAFVDLAFDAGEIWAALKQRRPRDAISRFLYVQPEWYQPRSLESL
jgi:glycosyltransferase involved in cell wall biosynthesis